MFLSATLSGAPLSAERPRQNPLLLPRNPNIIFIVVEGLGYGQLACYGQKLIRTPNLDRMAAEGVRFTDYYGAGPVCPATRYSLMTGLRPRNTTAKDADPWLLRVKDWTVASMLKQAGYSTAIFGMWGLGSQGSEATPQKKGFDEWFGFLDPDHASEAYPSFLWRNDTRLNIPQNAAEKQALYANDFFTQAAVNFIRSNVKTSFFLHLTYTLPDPKRGLLNLTPYSGEQWSQEHKTLAAMVTRLDKDVHAILAQLKELQIDRNTAVFFTSDHAPVARAGIDPEFFHSNGPFRGGVNELFEGNLRLPLIARWPGHIKSGVVSTHPAAAWDLVPTAVEIANMGAPPGMDGRSLIPLLKGESVKDRGPFYWELRTQTNHLQAIRSGPWKAVRSVAHNQLELYDLRNDPQEVSNLAKTQPETVAQLVELMSKASK